MYKCLRELKDYPRWMELCLPVTKEFLRDVIHLSFFEGDITCLYIPLKQFLKIYYIEDKIMISVNFCS